MILAIILLKIKWRSYEVIIIKTDNAI
jgi:hypothetical protein